MPLCNKTSRDQGDQPAETMAKLFDRETLMIQTRTVYLGVLDFMAPECLEEPCIKV